MIGKFTASFSRSNVYFKFMLECLRWGPTSLQTVKQHFSGVYTVCTMLGAENINLKYTLLRHFKTSGK